MVPKQVPANEPTRDVAAKPAWSRPKLDELGHLRDFVRTGNAFGKSILINDGEAKAGGESMP